MQKLPQLLKAAKLRTTKRLTALAEHGLNSAKFTYQWYKDGEAIDGATESTYEVTESGSYYVTVNAVDEATVLSSEVSSEAKDYVIARTT